MSDIGQSERSAFLSLAKTQRRLSWNYRDLASICERDGDLDGYRANLKEARRLRSDARFHLDHARMRDAS